MKARAITIVALVLLLTLTAALYAQEVDPLAIVNAWVAALNAGDVDGALSYLADDAVLTFIPPPIPGDDGIFSGKDEIRGWYEGLVAAQGVTTKGDCTVEGEQVTCLHDKYTDADLQKMGVDYLEMEWVATVRDGKIQGYTATMTPESLAKLAPPPESLAETGGIPLTSTLPLGLVAGGLAAVALAVGLRRLPGRAR
jgi:ketosteroid isomerase-like protein